MKKSTSLKLLLGALMLMLTVGMNAQQAKLNKSVVGTGGAVGIQNSQGVQLSGIMGQFVIGTLNSAVPGSNSQTLNQGFWIPEPESTTGINDEPVSVNKEFFNYPNPVNNTTTFRFNLKSSATISLKVYDMVGNLIKTVFDGFQTEGMKDIPWNVRNEQGLPLESGSYIYELQIRNNTMAGNSNIVMKNVLVVVK